eukprot:CAMPEP_0184696296 /NCGR_PEP_ID=MMETSP0313-20130426/3638_1 /TAXON_ID=2792 /ORGANISM="Porphyridium aerugineum, Strain SAG 1380-2" /LENGTH=247 /DNA_ID=CAMNT_0027154899 /DNA_START=276 /DNA_END=1019 /DNA_ORIENTATION=+
MAGVVPSDLIFRQLFEQESSTFTYLLSDKNDPTKTAVLIDTVDLMADRDTTLVKELGLDVKFLFSTHVHADHLTGNRILKDKHFHSAVSLLSKNAGGRADQYVTHMERIAFGDFELEARSTPGHTNGCMSFVLFRKGGGNESAIMAFTGDALLIRGCGRTDFQQGDPRKLYQSVHSQIFSLPDETILYPAHDYKGRMLTYVGEEKRLNPRLTKSEDEFVNIMNNLNLPYPKKIDASLPYNLVCGYND